MPVVNGVHSAEFVMASPRSLLCLLLVAAPAPAAERCECPRTVRATLPLALSASLVDAVTDACVRAAPSGPYELVAEFVRAAGGSTLTVRLRSGSVEVRAWTTSSPDDDLEAHREAMVEQLRASRPFADVIAAFEQRATRCEVDLQGREAFSHGEEVELLVRPTPEPGRDTRLVVQLARGELVGATAVEKRQRTWAFVAASPLSLSYRAPDAKKDLLTVFGSCEVRPTPQVPLTKTLPGPKLCEVELPVLERGRGASVSGSWTHSWDYSDSTYRYVGSHEVTFEGTMPSSAEGPVALYSSPIGARWEWKSKVELLSPEAGCPALYTESSGGGSYQGEARLSIVEIAKAGGPVAAAQMKAAGVTDFYAFDFGGSLGDELEAPGRQVNGASHPQCLELHDIRVPVPYPSMSVSQPKSNKPIFASKKWASMKNTSNIEVTQGNEPGTSKRPTVSPAEGGNKHFYSYSFDVKFAGKNVGK